MAVIQVLAVLCILVVGVYSVGLFWACTSISDCTEANMFCSKPYSTGSPCATSGRCLCMKGFVKSGTTCVSAQYIGDSCIPFSDDHCAVTVSNTECYFSKCICHSDGTVVSKYNCVSPSYKRIGEPCIPEETCYSELETRLVEEACPDGGICLCPSGFKASGHTCIPVMVGGWCTSSRECPIHAECGASKCVCSIVHDSTTDKTGCAYTSFIYGEASSCSSGDACLEAFTCAQCNPDSLSTFACARTTGHIGAECSIDSDCSSGLAICSSGTCVCGTGYLAYGRVLCLPSGKISNFCFTNTECPKANSLCINNVCACAPTYAVDPAGTDCQFTSGDINAYCVTNAHCNTANSVCTNNVCVCAPKYAFNSYEGYCIRNIGSDIKSVWVPLAMMSGLLTILSLKSF